MKNVLVLAALFATLSVYSQGTVSFMRRDTANGVNAFVSYMPGRPVPGLYGGPAGTSLDQLVLLARG